MLFSFLLRNLKGYRFLVVLAILVTFLQVGSNVLVSYPLKYIPDKLNKIEDDPACAFPLYDTYGILAQFDRFDQANVPSKPTQCPVPKGKEKEPLRFTQHSQVGVIIFSVIFLLAGTLRHQRKLPRLPARFQKLLQR